MTAPSQVEAVQLAAVLKWRAADEDLTRAKHTELELRIAAVAAVFPKGLGEGTTNAVLHDRSTLKAVVRPTAKVDQKMIRAAEARLRGLGEAGALLADRLIKWTAEASVAEFKKLTPAHRKLFKDAIAIVLSKHPSLELKPAD